MEENIQPARAGRARKRARNEEQWQRARAKAERAKGMRCTKEDDIKLKELQKLQIEERRRIEKEQQEIELMWHQVLMDDCTRKENLERMEARRRYHQTLECRRCYDEQIASANKKRQELIKLEREKENRKLEKMKKKMEQEHYEAIKKKKNQQQNNKNNYIEGHENKLLRLRNEKMCAREIDNGTIKVALEDLRRERERNRIQMKNLQLVKQLCVEHFNRERKMRSALEEETDKVADEWLKHEQEKMDEQLRQLEREKRARKQKAAEEYKKHIQARNMELERVKQERNVRMERVKRSAFCELQSSIDNTNQELKRQLDYRNALNSQIKDNQIQLESELINIENKDRTFTKKAQMFKGVMTAKLTSSPARTSTNPVHPFRKLMESKKPKESFHLPSIG